VRLLILLLVGAALLDGGAAAGSLLASGLLVMMTGSQLGRIVGGLRTPGVTAALHRLADRSETAWGAPPLEPPAGMALVLDDVAWRPAEMLPDAIYGVSFSIPTNGSLAIVAPPRSGATTIARLAAGWLSPSSGTVCARPAILLGTQWLHGSGRVRDLLAMGNDLSDTEMIEMIEAIGLAQAIAPRGGLDLRLSAGAPELSGGQRRRLMLAGALLRKPALLVLDGTLEAVGTETAAELLGLCRARGSAVLLAGHRDDLSALCDARYDHAVAA
jgi:ATP-binding cassette subfamily C protein CydC